VAAVAAHACAAATAANLRVYAVAVAVVAPRPRARASAAGMCGDDRGWPARLCGGGGGAPTCLCGGGRGLLAHGAPIRPKRLHARAPVRRWQFVLVASYLRTVEFGSVSRAQCHCGI